MPVITLFSYFPDGEKILASGAWATRSKKPLPDIYFELENEKIEEMIEFAKFKKLSSVLDFPYYIVTIEGVSRVFTHQWVRYRLASHMQQSLRFVEIDISNFEWFVIPPSILKEDVNEIIKYIEVHQLCAKLYKDLINSGTPVQDARFVLPNSVKTHISSAFDAEEVLHIIKQRTCLDAQWEIRIVSTVLLALLYLIHPRIFSNWGPYCLAEGKCMGFHEDKSECKSWVKKIKEILNFIDRIRPEFKKIKNNEIFEIDFTDYLGFKVSEDKKKKVFEHFGKKFELDYKVIGKIRKIRFDHEA